MYPPERRHYWKGSIDAPALLAAGAELRARHWKLQRDKGISVIPSNDFSFYDQVLDMTAALGAIPPRFLTDPSTKPTHPNGSARGAMEEATRGAGHIELDRAFAMARGTKDAPAMEMTKWFDTNYHYIVPEFHKDQTFKLSSRKAVEEFNEAKALGIVTRPVLIGPVTYLMLGKVKGEEFDPISLLDTLLPVYGAAAGRTQIRRRRMGADRRAGAGARSVAGAEARSAPRLPPACPGGAEDHAGELFRRIWPQPRRRRRSSRCPVIMPTSCAGARNSTSC